MKGRLIIVSAPAGAGKTTLVEMLKKEFPEQVTQSISCTTRKPRPKEVDGKDYFFLSKRSFEERIERKEFLEYAIVFEDYYGTLKERVMDQQLSGKDVILVIDTQGALELKKKVEALLIFIAPPSLDVLKKRLRERRTESSDALKKRLQWAEKEMTQISHYDHVVVNDDLKTAYLEFKTIIIRKHGSKGGNQYDA